MKTRELDMIVDRELRNGALALVKADIANVKQDLSTKGIKDRVTHRMTDGAVDLFEDATEMADNNRGALAAQLFPPVPRQARMRRWNCVTETPVATLVKVFSRRSTR